MVDLAHHKVLLVGKTPSLTWRAVRALNRVGVRPYVLSAMRFHLGSLINRSIRVESFDPQAMLPLREPEELGQESADELSVFSDKLPRLVADYCSKYGISLVLPIDLPTLLPISDASAWMADQGIRVFPVASSQLVRDLHDKWLFSKRCTELGLPQPLTARIDEVDQLDGLTIPYPLLVKPLNRANSAGIHVFDSRAALTPYLAKPNPFNRLPLLVQQYIPGQDMGFSLLAEQGEIRAWTCFHQHRYQRHFVDRPDILEQVRRLVSATGFHGIAHIDLRQGTDGVARYLEVNPRVWGSLLYSVNAGVNFLELGLRLALGESLETHFKPVKEAWVGVALKDRVLGRVHHELARL